MKIVFVISGLSTGGAEIMLYRLLCRLDRDRFSPSVVSLNEVDEIGKHISALGITVEAMQFKKSWTKVVPLFKLLRYFWVSRPDVVHTWLYHADLIGGLAAKLTAASGVVWSIRSADIVQDDTKLSTKAVIKACSIMSRWIPDIVVYNSNSGLEFHQKYGYTEKCRQVIFNGIDAGAFSPKLNARNDMRDSLNLPLEARLVGMVARFDPIKNFDGFMSMASLVASEVPDAYFVLVGEGVDDSNVILAEMISRYGLDGRVFLLGRQENLQNIYPAFDLSCLCSWSEAFPNVVLESLACGVPCVSTDVGDFREITGDDVWVVPVGDMNSMSQKIIGYFRESNRNTESELVAMQKQVIERFSIIKTVIEYEEVYDSVMESRIE